MAVRSPKTVPLFLFTSAGAVKTGATPTFTTYIDETGSAVTPPSIVEVGGGAYKFTPTFTAGHGIFYCIAPGSGVFPTAPCGYLRPEDFGVDDLLDIEQGQWEIIQSGGDMNKMVLTSPDGVVKAKFALTDGTGAPATTNIFKRVPTT